MGAERSSQGRACGAPRPKGCRACVHADPPSQALGGPNGPPRHSRGRHSSRSATPDVQRRREPAGSGRGLAEAPQSCARGVGSRRGLGSERPPPSAPRWGWGVRRSSQLLHSGPGRWAAAARALGLCRSEPATCPRAPQVTRQPQAGGPGGPWDRRPRCVSHLALCQNSCLPYS